MTNPAAPQEPERARTRAKMPPPLSARADTAATTTAGPRVYTCVCGADYRVHGSGKHRIYWPLDSNQAVLHGTCEACSTVLPGKRDVR